MNEHQAVRLIQRRRLYRPTFPLILIVGSVAISACLLVATIRLLRHEGDTTYPESCVAWTGLSACRTGHLYPNIDQSPYTPAPYGPLLYIGLDAAGRFAGNLHTLIFFGRLVSFACFLAVSLISYRFCRRCELPRQTAVLAALFILSQHMYFRWTATLRPDLAGLVLTGIAFCLVTQSRVSATRIILSGLAMGLALSVKQTFVALPFAAAVWLISEKRFRDVLLLTVTAVIPIGTIIGILSFSGEPVLQHMLVLGHTINDPAGVMSLLKPEFLENPADGLVLILAGIGLLGCIHASERSLRVLPIYFAISWCWALLTMTHVGADLNYTLEAWMVTAILAAFGAGELSKSLESSVPLVRLGFSLSIAWMLLLSFAAAFYIVHHGIPHEDQKLVELFRSKRILSDDPYLEARSRAPEMLDPFILHTLELTGHWSSAPVLREIQGKEFDFIVLLSPPHIGRLGMERFSDSILKGIHENYSPLCGTSEFVILGARGRENLNDSAALGQACVSPH